MAGTQKKQKNFVWGLLLVTVVVALGAVTFLVSPGESPTSFVQSSLAEKVASLPLIIREQTAQALKALFDLHITILPEQKTRSVGQPLSFSVELLDIQSSGAVPITLNYLVTNEKGDVVYIEHEQKVVETQSSFLKELRLPQLSPGQYKLYVELLYSDKSAAARDEFKVE